MEFDNVADMYKCFVFAIVCPSFWGADVDIIIERGLWKSLLKIDLATLEFESQSKHHN
jgi:hypothetical protein